MTPCAPKPLRTALVMYNGSIGRVTELNSAMSLADAVAKEKLEDALDRAQSALARAAKHLAKYDSTLGEVNFLEKGDGSELTQLNDYIEEESSAL